MCEYQDPVCFEVDSARPMDGLTEHLESLEPDVPLDGSGRIDPLTAAALLLKCRAVRLAQCRDGGPEIDDISWHVMLGLMVSTADGASATVHDLAITHEVAASTMLRYVRYLAGFGLIEANDDRAIDQRTPIKLTASGMSLAGNTLEKIGCELEKA